MRNKLLGADGMAKLAPKQGDRVKAKKRKSKKEDISICLNCTRKRCSGYCKKIGRSRGVCDE